MVVKVRIFGAQKLVDQMGTNVIEVEFAGGTIKDVFGTLLERHGFTWADFPLLKDWVERWPTGAGTQSQHSALCQSTGR